MAHQHPDMPARRVPGMVLAGLRDGSLRTRAGVDDAALRTLTRIVMRADAAGLDVAPLLPDYVAGADAAMDRDGGIDAWTPTMHGIHAIAWPLAASSAATRSTFHDDAGRPESLDALTAAFTAWIAARHAELDVPPGEADRAIQGEMERVRALFPRLGLSYGYVGNVWWGPYEDDRSFRIFTRVHAVDDHRGTQFGMGDHGHAELPRLRTMVLARLEGWARDLDARIDAGTVRTRPDHHADLRPAMAA